MITESSNSKKINYLVIISEVDVDNVAVVTRAAPVPEGVQNAQVFQQSLLAVAPGRSVGGHQCRAGCCQQQQHSQQHPSLCKNIEYCQNIEV